MVSIRTSLILLLALSLAGQVRAEDAAPSPEEVRREEDAVLRRARRFERSVVRLVEKIRPTTVAVESWRDRPVGSGSGVIISHDGFVLTNYHVIQPAKRVVVVLHGGERLDATVVGTDRRGDVALLKTDPRRRLPYTNPRRGDSARLDVGAWVFATGNPFGLGADGEPVVTLGVVSGLGRVTAGQFMYGDSIQHDAEVNPGNSGGPLFDLNGRLLGINGRIASSAAGGGGPSSSGVSYAIPMHQIRNFLTRLMDGERNTHHGDQLAGLKVTTGRDEEGMSIGAQVTGVTARSPAATTRGGFEAGDVIWKITVRGKSTEVVNQTQYLNVMSRLPSGTMVKLHVLRDGRRLSVRLRLDDTWLSRR